MIIILNYIIISLPKISVIAMGLGKIGLILNWARRFYRIFDSSVWTPVATVGVSWLKIKPIVLIFPVIESTSVDSVTHTTVKILWGEDSFTFFSYLIWLRFFIFPSYIYTEVFGRQQTCFASLMPKIWALVSNFPVIESASADSIAHTTVRSLWREHSFTLFRNWLYFVSCLKFLYLIR